jgi:hypothetical protein
MVLGRPLNASCIVRVPLARVPELIRKCSYVEVRNNKRRVIDDKQEDKKIKKRRESSKI